MGHVEVAHISHALPDGRVLIDDASFRVGEARGNVRTWSAPRSAEEAEGGAETGGADIDVVATIHPSAVLRGDDRQQLFDGFVADLRVAAQILE